ncbi:MAG: hypothetical protein ACAF41_02870 [Leptolyngbya sp. BL-A-14]
MPIKPVVGRAAIAAIALIVTYPLVAEAIPQRSRTACIQRTAEELGAPTSDVRITNVGPVSAESGATTLLLENRKTGETANCRVNTIDNTVLSVTLNNGGSTPSDTGSNNASGQRPAYWVVTASRTFLKASPGVLSKTVTNNVPNGTVLRNFGCQRRQTPTWCQVEFRDDPSVKGWAWSPDLKEYRTESSTRPSTSRVQPGVGTPVDGLSDLVGARAGQAENAITQRGYRFVKSQPSGDAVYSYWREARTNYCVTIRTANGRYESIVYGLTTSCSR